MSRFNTMLAQAPQSRSITGVVDYWIDTLNEEDRINAENAKKLALQQEADTRHTNMKQILKDNTSYKKAVSDYTKGIDNAGTFTTDLKKALNEAGNTDYDAEIDNVTKALDNLKNVTSEKEMET